MMKRKSPELRTRLLNERKRNKAANFPPINVLLLRGIFLWILLFQYVITPVSTVHHRGLLPGDSVEGVFFAPISEDHVSLTFQRTMARPLQDPVSLVENSDISDETVLSQPNHSGTSQQSKNEVVYKDEYQFDYTMFTHDFHEYEQGQKCIIVKGRLRKNIQFWRDIGASDFILDVLKFGYKIPFYSTPTITFCKNNKSALSEPEFVSCAIQDLLDRSLIVRCSSPPRVVNPLTVSIQNSGKKRLILDLRNVNKHLWKQSVKFEDLRIALSYLQKGSFMIKFDITSAYHFIEIFEPHTEFLGFSWVRDDGQVIFYKFLVLPFGLSSACYIFTKVTRPLIAKWRSEGKLVLTFLDDGLGCASDYEKALLLSNEVKQDLLLSGFIPNANKCVWLPTQVLHFLGAILNSKDGIIMVSEERINKAKLTASQLLHDLKVHRRAPVRKVASLVGQVISMTIVIGHVTQIMTRYLSIDILHSLSWDSYICLSQESIKQIKFWIEQLDNVNSRNIFQSQICSRVVYSDASSLGFAGYEVNTLNGVSHGQWSPEESKKSSTWRELFAVYSVLRSLTHVLMNQRVKWFSDNQGVVSIVTKGSMNEELQEISLDIFKLCLCKSISLEIEWIPRSLNEKADYLSKIVDNDDWGISLEIFVLIEKQFGKMSIDWFASEYNHKLPRFYSKFWHPSSQGVDAFTVS